MTAEYSEYNTTDYLGEYNNITVPLIIISIICCIGIPLNGIVIWLLGFQIKRNPFTVFILNLAIVDFGYLVFLAVLCIFYFINSLVFTISFMVILSLSHVMYITSLFLLTAISIDRCVSVLFPIWHRCSRPKYLSPAVCAFLWICSVLLVGIPEITDYLDEYFGLPHLYLVVSSVLCLPLITISTLILFIKICLKPKQIKCGRLLVMILITLLCFLILTLPLNIFVFHALYVHMTVSSEFFLIEFMYLGAYFNVYMIVGGCLNSTVNPVIYYLVGRKKKARTRESIKVIFERVFKED